MTRPRKIVIVADDMLPANARERIERMMGAMAIETIDGDLEDDEALFDERERSPLRLLLLGPDSAFEPGGREGRDSLAVRFADSGVDTPRSVRLSLDDIDRRTRRYETLILHLSRELERPGLVEFVRLPEDAGMPEQEAWALRYPADPLATRILRRDLESTLRAEAQLARLRAEGADTEIDSLRQRVTHLEHAREEDQVGLDAARAATLREQEAHRTIRLRLEAAEALNRDLENGLKASRAESAWLRAALDGATRSPSLAPADKREAVIAARLRAQLAVQAAARAAAAAEACETPLQSEDGTVAYRGETLNGRPHGAGVMQFWRDGAPAARFEGEFSAGRRTGLGIGRGDGGYFWSGDWSNDEAGGFGALVTPDGRLYEGEVTADADGAPRQTASGWLWPAQSAHPRDQN